MGVVGSYILLIFALSFLVDYIRKRKVHKELIAFLRALLVSMLTTVTPLLIVILVFVYGTRAMHEFFVENLTVSIALLIFIPLVSYFSYRRLIK